ncbi:MAG: hypothetical protein LBU89_13480 [Fibromonadaceae bacterium]|jgi:hypothetical protein|nr:hypothetical protein [Fibromonadaceae bacterium]
MKKVFFVLVSCVAFAMPVFSAEAICAPNFEVVGMNQDFGISSVRVLQGSMQTRMNSRQLLMSPLADSIATTDDLNRQVNWAKSRNCTYLLQTTLTRLGETVQVSARLMDLNSSSYIFKKAYKANSPDDLHPIFSQLGNTLQDPKFAAIETIYDVSSADARSLTKKKTSTYWTVSVGGSYFSNFEDLFGIGVGYFIDGRTFMGELVYNWRFSEHNYIVDFGLRAYYPFTDKNSAFYIGGGASFVTTEREREINCSQSWYCGDEYTDGVGMLIESAAGYLIGRTSNFMLRIEANANAIITNDKSIGAGVRMIIGFD